jgi:UDPglucose 6-dehydrogenase
MKVSVIGTGYVGLVSGVCLAEKGHQVYCVDIDGEKVAKINQGIPPIFEKGLEELLEKNIGRNLTATSDISKAVQQSEISLIAVGTPFDGGEIDLTFIRSVSQQIGQVLRSKDQYHVVVVKSTVVPGTTDGVVLPLLEKFSGKKAGDDFGVGMNPEFLREGEAVDDFMNPDRIVLGAIDARSLQVLRELYQPFTGVDIVATNTRTAEMIKYAANSLLATMISFSNEIANLCTALRNIDVAEVMQGVHLDKRLSPVTADGDRIVPAFITYIEAGCGFGGSCFPKDVKALISHGRQKGLPMPLLESVVRVNEKQPLQVISLVRKYFPSLHNVPLAVLGLAFKPGTDDMRESPAIPIVNELRKEGAMLQAYDPVASREAQKIFGNTGIQYCETLQQAIREVQGIIILTRWQEFKGLPDMIRKLESQPVIIDGRRMLDKTSVANYDGIGM